MEIWTIKIECISGCHLKEKTAKICEIQNTFDLDDLCYFILDSFKFDDDHLHEFFISKTPTHRVRNTIDDESILLKDVFPTAEKHHLFMHFDFGDTWIFKITHSRKKTEFKARISYPRIVERIGKNPKQYP